MQADAGHRGTRLVASHHAGGEQHVLRERPAVHAGGRIAGVDTDADPAVHHERITEGPSQAPGHHLGVGELGQVVHDDHELIPTGPADGGTPSGRERLGHSSIAITANLYTHVFDTVALDGADRLAALLTNAADADVSKT